MPELPEVETVVRQISPAVTNKKITGLVVHKGGTNMIAPLTTAELESRINNRIVTVVSRVGKFMIFQMDDNAGIVAHLRMSGRLHISDKPISDKHTRIVIGFENSFLNFVDIRRFGTFHFSQNPADYPGLKRLGPDALSGDFNPEYLRQKIKNRKKSIYATLLDQSIVAGLGNIYVNEVLHASGIHPLRIASAISEQEITRIINETSRILTMAINFRGTTLIDNFYKDGKGEYGGFFDKLEVYGKDKLNHEVKRIKIGGRSVFYTSDQV